MHEFVVVIIIAINTTARCESKKLARDHEQDMGCEARSRAGAGLFLAAVTPREATINLALWRAVPPTFFFSSFSSLPPTAARFRRFNTSQCL